MGLSTQRMAPAFHICQFTGPSINQATDILYFGSTLLQLKYDSTDDCQVAKGEGSQKARDSRGLSIFQACLLTFGFAQAQKEACGCRIKAWTIQKETHWALGISVATRPL